MLFGPIFVFLFLRRVGRLIGCFFCTQPAPRAHLWPPSKVDNCNFSRVLLVACKGSETVWKKLPGGAPLKPHRLCRARCGVAHSHRVCRVSGATCGDLQRRPDGRRKRRGEGTNGSTVEQTQESGTTATREPASKLLRARDPVRPVAYSVRTRRASCSSLILPRPSLVPKEDHRSSHGISPRSSYFLRSILFPLAIVDLAILHLAA